MYAAPAIVPAAGMVRRTAFLTFIPLLIASIAVILIGGTIVIALIPLYLEHKTVTKNTDVLTSQQITMSVEVEQNNARRKRTTGDLSQYVGGEFTSAGREMIRSKLLPSLSSTKLQDLIMTSISIGYYNQNRKRKHFTLLKRATGQKIALIMKFNFIFISGCLLGCQTEHGSDLRNSLYSIPLTRFDFTNIPISINGVFETISQIKFINVFYVSPILSGVNSATPIVPILTANLTESTTITIATTTSTTTPTTPTTINPTTTRTTITTTTTTTTPATTVTTTGSLIG